MDIILLKRMLCGAAHRTPQEALLCAKTMRQQESAQPKRKLPPRFAEEHTIFNRTP